MLLSVFLFSDIFIPSQFRMSLVQLDKLSLKFLFSLLIPMH